MMSETIRWEIIKEPRDGYFVVYHPAEKDLAFVTLVFLETPPAESVIGIMEEELEIWITRYPVPTMVSSFNCYGECIRLKSQKPSDDLRGYIAPATHAVVASWRRLNNAEYPAEQMTGEYRHCVYANARQLSPATADERAAVAVARKRMVRNQRILVRTGWWLVFGWLVLIPVALIILQKSVPFVAVIITLYALGKAGIQSLKLLGKWSESEREKTRKQNELAMKHHHYHCKRNPKGFALILAENFKRDEEERTRQEYQELKSSTTPPEVPNRQSSR